MEKKDIELIEQHRKANYELNRLWEEHLGFESKLEPLEAVKMPSTDENSEIHKLKKLKLEGKDRIEQILVSLR